MIHNRPMYTFQMSSFWLYLIIEHKYCRWIYWSQAFNFMLKYSVKTGKVSSACLCKIDVILCTRNNFHGQKLGNLSQASHNKTKKYFKAICQRLFEVKITFDSNCDTAETESSTCNICIKIFEINLKYRKKSQCV